MQAAPLDLRTDSQGTLTVRGLPRGRYSVAAAGGEADVEVRPGATTDARITAP